MVALQVEFLARHDLVVARRDGDEIGQFGHPLAVGRAVHDQDAQAHVRFDDVVVVIANEHHVLEPRLEQHVGEIAPLSGEARERAGIGHREGQGTGRWRFPVKGATAGQHRGQQDQPQQAAPPHAGRPMRRPTGALAILDSL